jgi:hypothetical protein
LLNSLIDKEVSLNGLRQIVDFAYTYECAINEANVRELLHASNYLGVNYLFWIDLPKKKHFQVKYVKDGCEKFLVQFLTSDNCLELRDLADQHSCQQLLAAIDLFLLEHFAVSAHKRVKRRSFYNLRIFAIRPTFYN